MAHLKLVAALLCAAIVPFVPLCRPVSAQESDPPSVVPLDIQFSRSPTPVKANGRDHLLYEMRLTNFSGRTITLTAIKVFNCADGRSIAAFQADDLLTMIATPGQQIKGADRLTIGPGRFVVVYFDTIVPHGTAAGLRLGHRITVASATTAPGDTSHTILEAIPLAAGSEPPVLLGAPLKSGRWLAANALSNASDHRRTIAVVNGQARIAQRYAIDFVKLDARGRAFAGDPSKNENWIGYGQPVLAVADAIVERVYDGLLDNEPLAAPSIKIGLDTIAGNHVVLLLPSGERVLYGHLEPGSIKVKEGERVREGQILAALGNSGQSDAPHLHIHLADTSSALGAEGLAFAFRTFRLEGYAPSLDILESPEGWADSERSEVTVRKDELPTDLAVVSF